MAIVGTKAVAEKADIKAIQAEVDRKLKAIASRELGVPQDQIVVRDALPSEDFGLTNEAWTLTPSAANAYTTYINKTIDDNKFVAIYGVGCANASNVTLIKFTSGARTLDIWDTSFAQNLQDKIKVSASPILLRQNTPIKIDIYATSTGTVTLTLLARVAEVKGKTVEPGSVQ